MKYRIQTHRHELVILSVLLHDFVVQYIARPNHSPQAQPLVAVVQKLQQKNTWQSSQNLLKYH